MEDLPFVILVKLVVNEFGYILVSREDKATEFNKTFFDKMGIHIEKMPLNFSIDVKTIL
jgi:hypothetical protein